MRKILTVILFFLIANSAFSQLKYPGQWTLNITSGASLPLGFNAHIGTERYFARSAGSLSLGIDYLQTKQFITIQNFNISTVTGSFLYSYSFENIIRSPFLINLGAGMFLGTENFHKATVPEGILQNHGSKLTYGITVKPQFEYLIGRRISLLVEPSLRYYLQARFFDLVFTPSIGLKIYL